METLKKIFNSVVIGHKQSDFQKSWDRERSQAQKYGPSHVNEIDTIFSRHLEESR